MFDLNLISLNLINGQEQAAAPGLYAAAAPKRSARGRDNDRLVLYLNLIGSAPLSPDGIQQLLERLSQVYFRTPGTVTSALRTLTEQLNSYLLERNLSNTGVGRQSLGLFSALALHGSQLILAQCGPTHTFLVSPTGVEHYTDTQLAGRGLGLTRTLSIRYYQAELNGSHAVLLSPEPPAAWNDNMLAGAAALSLENLKRRLLHQSQHDLKAALVQIQPGSGKLRQPAMPALRPERPAVPAVQTGVSVAPTPVEKIPTPAEKSSGPVETTTPAPLMPEAAEAVPTPPAETPRPDAEPAPQAAPQAVPQAAPPAPQPAPERPAAAAAAGTALASNGSGEAVDAAERAQARIQARERARESAGAAPRAGTGAGSQAYNRLAQMLKRPPRLSREQLGAQPVPQTPQTGPGGEPIIQEMQRKKQPNMQLQALAPAWLKAKAFRQRTGRATQAVFARVLPTSGEPSVFSTATKIAIAVVVPLVVAAVVLTVYLERRQVPLYESYMAQARSEADLARAAADPVVVRAGWEKVLSEVSQAEKIRRANNDTRAVRQEAWDALDKLDGITRMEFQPALIDDLQSTVRVEKIVGTSGDLYLLDATQGRVLRATLTGRGYALDTTFMCGPGPFGNLIISNLVDMAAMPVNNTFKATIMAMDSNGNLMYCVPGESPFVVQIATPSTNWGKIQAFTVESNDLYVLDPQTNYIWIYTYNGGYPDIPNQFTGQNAPALTDVVDLAVNGQDLYLLHQDGHMTTCTISLLDTIPTRCADPAPYADARPGRQPNPVVFEGTAFTQMQYTPPPDPSLYLLDQASGGIFHVSLRLNLQRVLKPSPATPYPPAGLTPTAFAVGPNRSAFVAFGNQVYYAFMP